MLIDDIIDNTISHQRALLLGRVYEVQKDTWKKARRSVVINVVHVKGRGPIAHMMTLPDDTSIIFSIPVDELDLEPVAIVPYLMDADYSEVPID